MIGRRTCLECLKPFAVKKHEQRFCSTPCRKGFHRRREQRGAEMYDLVMAWRHDRKGHGPAALAYLCGMATGFRADDLKAGRSRSWLTVLELRDQLIQYGFTRFKKVAA